MAVVAILVTFIAVRRDVLLVGALYATAEVLAAALTAAVAAMRSAAESSAAAGGLGRR